LSGGEAQPAGLDGGAIATLSRVALGSVSPAKVMAVEAALRRVHGRFVAVTHVRAPSHVADQPVGDEETLRGARARAEGALRLVPGALLGVGIEAGVAWRPGADVGADARGADARGAVASGAVASGAEAHAAEPPRSRLFTSAWVVAVDRGGREGSACSAAFEVPSYLAAAVMAGAELGTALDAAFGLERAKDGPGAAGVLSRGLVTRSELYVPAVLLALLPWVAPEPPAGALGAAP